MCSLMHGCHCCHVSSILEVCIFKGLFKLLVVYGKIEFTLDRIKLDRDSVSRSKSLSKIDSILVRTVSDFSRTEVGKS